MSEALVPAIPGQRHVQVSVSMQTGGCLSLSLETMVVLGQDQGDATEAIKKATQQLLESIPTKEVERIEKEAAADSDNDDIVTKEPHPLFVKLVGELSKLNKTMEKKSGA